MPQPSCCLMLCVLTACATLVAVSHAQGNVSCPPDVLTTVNMEILSLFSNFSTPSCRNMNSTTCDVFVAMRPNLNDSRFLDIFMTANASGWVAVGFSDTRSMSAADVVGCKRSSTGLVEVVDTWNPAAAGSHTPNQLDKTQNGICLHNATFQEGRIACYVSKFSEVLDQGMDLPLNHPYFIIYGRRFSAASNNGSAQGLEQHSEVPYITLNRINPFTPSSFVCPTTNMTPNANVTLSFGLPPGCPRANCDVYVTMAPNPMNASYLDIYMEGIAAGWVAVGFSNSRAMENTDVIGCRVDSGSTVSVVDTWNPSPNYSPNQVDDTQDGVCTHSASFNNGRISCLLSKYTGVVNPHQDLNLNASHYIFYGRRTTPNNMQLNLQMHTSTPTRSTEPINPVTNETIPLVTLIPNCTSTLLGPDSVVSIIFRSPSNCSRTACDLYVSMAVNTNEPGYLDIYMEGNASGWVAVGFSSTRTMANSDVIGCKMDSGSTVSVVDSWNPSPNYSPNEPDPTQNGVCLHRANFTDGRISCLISKYARIVDIGRDLDLNASYFIMYGRRMSSNAANGSNVFAAGLLRHESAPLLSNGTFNPLSSSFVPESYVFPRDQLLQLHGILMIIAWPLIGIIGMFFASWMKPALPNGEWLQAHRALLVTSLFIAIVGFFTAFIANANQSTPGFVDTSNLTSLVHFGVGVLLMVLQVINPMIAMCRCDPDHPKRWVFNVIHVYGIGLNAYILAMVNVGIGVSRFSDLFQSSVVFWIFVAYVSLEMSLEIVLHVVFVVTAFRSSPQNRKNLLPTTFRDLYSLCHRDKAKNSTIELQDHNKKEEEKRVEPMRKQPSEDSLIRWIGLGFHVAFAMLAVVMIIFISIGRTA